MKDSLLQGKYLTLLVALLVLLVGYPALRGLLASRLIYDGLLGAVFLVALLVIFRRRRLALFLGVPAVLGLWTGYVLPQLSGLPLALFFHASAAGFLCLGVMTLLADIHRRDEIESDCIHGALCGYLLVGLGFGHLYCIQELLFPDSFSASDEILARIRDGGQRHFQLVYFSFVTLTTVGYGDITPIKDGARGLAVIEVILGQFYLAVLIGELVGKKVAHALADRPADKRE